MSDEAINDSELLEQLARIEGAVLHKGLADGTDAYFLHGLRWNPLTNDADAFALLEKLKKYWVVEIDDSHLGLYAFDGNPFKATHKVQNADLKRAIALAVVEAHKQ